MATLRYSLENVNISQRAAKLLAEECAAQALLSSECKGNTDPSEDADGGEEEELSQLCP